jgi:hypothetical protein
MTDAVTGHFSLAAALLALATPAPAWADSASVSPDIAVTRDGVHRANRSQLGGGNQIGINESGRNSACP